MAVRSSSSMMVDDGSKGAPGAFGGSNPESLRANQLRCQALLRQLMLAERGTKRLDTLRLLRKCMRELDYQLTWLLQVDLFETLEKILKDERHDIEESEWRLSHDATQLLIEAIPRVAYDLDQHQVVAIFASVIENLGHRRSEVRRASLLLINMYLNERPHHFQRLLELFIEYGLANQRNPEAQRGAILSLPLLMTEHACRDEDLLPLVRCLADLLVDSSNTQLFYSLYLALQRLSLTLGERRFSNYMRQCQPEAILLYKQAASRSSSLAMANNLQPSQGSASALFDVVTNEPEACKSEDEEPASSSKQVTFEVMDSKSWTSHTNSPTNDDNEPQKSSSVIEDEWNYNQNEESDARRMMSSSAESCTPTPDPNPVGRNQATGDLDLDLDHLRGGKEGLKTSSSVSSTCSSEANLVDPAHYMNAAALSGRPLLDYGRLHPPANDCVTGDDVAINDLCVSCTPTTELNPMGSQRGELRFGIFPRHLVQAALPPSSTSTTPRHHHQDRLAALQEMMCIVRESPVNHLAILITYFDSFLEQFLAKQLEPQQQQQDQRPELISVDMLESIVIKTKVSTMQFSRPMIGLLVRSLAHTRWPLVRDNIGRLLHKMMAYMPPQLLVDALFEHRHHKSPVVREEVLNRATGAVLHYDRTEFNLTKLCYHVLPMLADQHAQVRLAALECIAALAHSLGPERIGSLLTAAEAVETGCDLDGLLDAIHARLQRRSLPRCNPDGSLRFVIKPFLSAGSAQHHHEQEAADVRWVLEAPSSHQHQHQHFAGADREQHKQYLEQNPLHQHAGHYSPASQRRGSLAEGLASLTQASVNSSRTHQHHHHRSTIEKLATGNGGSNEAAPNLPTRRPGNEPLVNTEVGDSEIHAKPKEEAKRRSSQAAPRSRADEAEPSTAPRVAPFQHSLVARSESRDSTSSSDTNKVLFQYYLDKFRQSLEESGGGGGVHPHSVLPSDSIIYTDPAQAYELSRHKSRQQQTSFDYEPLAPANGAAQGAIGEPPARGQQQEQQDRASLLQRSREESSEGASGAESPVTVLESSKGHRRRSSVASNLGHQVSKSRQASAEEAANKVAPTDPQVTGEQQKARSKASLVRQSASSGLPPSSDGDPNDQEEPNRSKGRDSEEASHQMKSAGSSADEVDTSDQTTQTTPTQSSRGRDAHRRRRHSRRASSSQRPLAEPDGGSSKDPLEKSEMELRRRESQSQPPVAFKAIAPRPRLLAGEQHRTHHGLRSVSVSPSLAGGQVNIREVLESVAEVEGAFQEPLLAYRVASEALASPCWSTKVEGILALIRLASHHAQVLLDERRLHETVQRLAQETRNLRSTVARSAIFALGDLCLRLRRALEPESELIVRALLQKSMENTAFIRDDIRRTLMQMVEALTQWRLASQLIAHGGQHKNQQVRRMAAQFVAQLVERMGAAKCLVGARDISSHLLPAAARFAQDSSPHTRYYGRLILARLLSHAAFERLLRKSLAPNLYRSSIGIVESVRRRGPGDPPPDS